MASPITWRSIFSNPDLSGASRLLDGANDSMQSAFDTFGSMFDDRLTQAQAEKSFLDKQTTRENTAELRSYLNTLGSPDAALAAQKSGDIETKISGYGGLIDGSAVADARGILGQSLSQSNQMSQYRDSQVTRASRGTIAGISNALLEGDEDMAVKLFKSLPASQQTPSLGNQLFTAQSAQRSRDAQAYTSASNLNNQLESLQSGRDSDMDNEVANILGVSADAVDYDNIPEDKLDAVQQVTDKYVNTDHSQGDFDYILKDVPGFENMDYLQKTQVMDTIRQGVTNYDPMSHVDNDPTYKKQIGALDRAHQGNPYISGTEGYTPEAVQKIANTAMENVIKDDADQNSEASQAVSMLLSGQVMVSRDGSSAKTALVLPKNINLLQSIANDVARSENPMDRMTATLRDHGLLKAYEESLSYDKAVRLKKQESMERRGKSGGYHSTQSKAGKVNRQHQKLTNKREIDKLVVPRSHNNRVDIRDIARPL